MGDKVDLLQLKARLEKLGVHIDAPAISNASPKRDKREGAACSKVGLHSEDASSSSIALKAGTLMLY
jgi:hypothetical protein